MAACCVIRHVAHIFGMRGSPWSRPKEKPTGGQMKPLPVLATVRREIPICLATGEDCWRSRGDKLPACHSICARAQYLTSLPYRVDP